MKQLLTIIFIGFLVISCKTTKQSQSTSNENLKIYTDFLNKEHTSSKDYVFELFKKYDIVILCERDHGEITQYDLIINILKDSRFQHIQNVYTEIGNSQYNDQLNDFLHNSSLTNDEAAKSALQMQRNMFPLWEKANYLYFLKSVHNINSKLKDDKKVNVFNLDFGICWEASDEEKKKQSATHSNDRDSFIAGEFIKYYKKSKTKKALVILNYRHAFLQDMFGRKNAGRFIADEFGSKVANVYINSFILKSTKITDQDVPETAIGTQHDGKWEASFIKSGKKDIAFNFAGTPFGNDAFDMIPFPNNLKYSDVFTGFIHYNYFPDLRRVLGIDGFIDDEFYKELAKRYQFYDEEIPPKNELKTDYNTVMEITYREEFSDAVKEIEKWVSESSDK